MKIIGGWVSNKREFNKLFKEDNNEKTIKKSKGMVDKSQKE